MAVKTVKTDSVQGEGFAIRSAAGRHTVTTDQPAAAGGTDTGPTPLDYLLIALGGCIGTIARIVASQNRIELRGMKVSVEGDINTDGLLGKPTEDPVGFSAIRIKADIDADLSREEKETFLHQVDQRCPVSSNLRAGTSITVTAV